jgi:hypothetical protein
MKKGKKNKVFNMLFTSLRIFFNLFKNFKIKINENRFSWINFFYITNFCFYKHFNEKTEFYLFLNNTLLTLNYSNTFNFNYKRINSIFFLKNFLFSLISKVSPIFSYFVYNVNKNIRKHSRGKSRKYIFIWKYIPPYKRINLAMRWIVKDIKFNQNKQLSQRLIKTFDNLFISYKKSFAWKLKIFSYNYVFKNFKKTLMTSLRTTS